MTKLFIIFVADKMNVMDKRILETILADQAEELALKQTLHFCQRKEEDRIDLSSPQAQVVIGVRRSG